MKNNRPLKYEVIYNGWNEHTDVSGIQYLFEFAEDHDGYSTGHPNFWYEEVHVWNQEEIVELEPFWSAVWDETKKAIVSAIKKEPCQKCGSPKCQYLECKILDPW